MVCGGLLRGSLAALLLLARGRGAFAGAPQVHGVCVHEVVPAIVLLQEEQHLALVPGPQALDLLVAGWAEVWAGPRHLWELGVLTRMPWRRRIGTQIVSLIIMIEVEDSENAITQPS